MKFIKKYNEYIIESLESEKIIIVKFPNGDEFSIPASVIANHRTKYYSEVDGYEENSEEWNEEFELSMKNDELYDWIQNNTDWSDIKEYATKLENDSIVDYDDMWSRAEFNVQ